MSLCLLMRTEIKEKMIADNDLDRRRPFLRYGTGADEAPDSRSVLCREALQKGEPMSDFEGSKKAVTQHDAAAELYAQEREALKRLIDDFGWPDGWPKPGQHLSYYDRIVEEDKVCILVSDFHSITYGIIGREDAADEIRASNLYLLPCGATEKMLRELLGGSLRAIIFPVPEDPLFSCVMINLDSSYGDTLTLALCAAVRAKLKAK